MKRSSDQLSTGNGTEQLPPNQPPTFLGISRQEDRSKQPTSQQPASQQPATAASVLQNVNPQDVMGFWMRQMEEREEAVKEKEAALRSGTEKLEEDRAQFEAEKRKMEEEAEVMKHKQHVLAVCADFISCPTGKDFHELEVKKQESLKAMESFNTRNSKLAREKLENDVKNFEERVAAFEKAQKDSNEKENKENEDCLQEKEKQIQLKKAEENKFEESLKEKEKQLEKKWNEYELIKKKQDEREKKLNKKEEELTKMSDKVDEQRDEFFGVQKYNQLLDAMNPTVLELDNRGPFPDIPNIRR